MARNENEILALTLTEERLEGLLVAERGRRIHMKKVYDWPIDAIDKSVFKGGRRIRLAVDHADNFFRSPNDRLPQVYDPEMEPTVERVSAYLDIPATEEDQGTEPLTIGTTGRALQPLVESLGDTVLGNVESVSTWTSTAQALIAHTGAPKTAKRGLLEIGTYRIRLLLTHGQRPVVVRTLMKNPNELPNVPALSHWLHIALVSFRQQTRGGRVPLILATGTNGYDEDYLLDVSTKIQTPIETLGFGRPLEGKLALAEDHPSAAALLLQRSESRENQLFPNRIHRARRLPYLIKGLGVLLFLTVVTAALIILQAYSIRREALTVQDRTQKQKELVHKQLAILQTKLEAQKATVLKGALATERIVWADWWKQLGFIVPRELILLDLKLERHSPGRWTARLAAIAAHARDEKQARKAMSRLGNRLRSLDRVVDPQVRFAVPSERSLILRQVGDLQVPELPDDTPAGPTPRPDAAVVVADFEIRAPEGGSQ